MADIVKPLKLENPASGGSQTNLFPTETNPNEDYIGCLGVSFKGSLSTLIYSDNNNELNFKDPVSGDHALKTLKGLDFYYSENTNPFLDHNNSTFRVVARFIFLGTNRLATPSGVRVILSGSSANNQGEFRLFDLTNNQTIATQLATVGTNLLIYSPSSSNWPTGEAILEVQLRKVAGSGESRISSLSILW